MTTRNTGRPAATTSVRTFRTTSLAALALALCLPAASTLAAPLDDAAPFRSRVDTATQGAAVPAPASKAEEAKPAAKPQLSPVTRVATDTVPLSTRALLLAADVHRALSPMNLLPSGELQADAQGEPVAAESDGKVKSVLQKALALLGTPYRWGGTDPDKGFDCSGLVGYVFRNALGIELPRVSRDMAKNGELITDRAKLVAGDLVFFGLKGRVNHVGIYVGEGRFVHAPSRGKDVTVSSLEQGYWSGRFMQARRVSTEG